MFFRNLLIYRITQDRELEAEALAEALASKPARPCANQELTTYGFIPPIDAGEGSALVHASSGYLLIATRKEERIPPSAAVKEALDEKVKAIEGEQMRKVYKKERDQLKDEIVMSLLPHTFRKKKTTRAAIMPKQGLILVDASSPRQAEDLLSTLREALGSLPVRPLSVINEVCVTMTDWLKNQTATHDLHILDDTQLKDAHEDGGSITVKAQDLTAEEIQNHLSAGKMVTRLALAWQDKLSFVLDEKLTLKNIRFEDLLQEQADQEGGDDALAQLDASFTIMMLTFAEFLPELVEALGGEMIPQGICGTSASDLQEGAPKVVRIKRDEVQYDAFNPVAEQTAAHVDDLDSDTLYQQAVVFVRTEKRASISAIQRRFKIGYNRAVEMIGRMEEEFVVTAMNSNGTRDVVASY
ncbi:recombination associated protein RdgC [Pseudomonas lutea]|uniref:Recombination-associated protein RdgC n=1 Tax=Pseudomonas lutea TaxID=243924 RepID=A0A9X8QLR9_9PSED|nr:recombination associated protein RdgC [Pseudomonas lutea]